MIYNLAKEILKAGGSTHQLIIPSEATNGLGLCNPTIINKNGELILNVRHVQYCLYHSENQQNFQSRWGPLSYLHPENDMTLTTKNFLCRLDQKTFDITSAYQIETTYLDVPPLWEFVGLEDGRLTYWDDKLYLIGVRRDTTPNGVGRMEYSEIENNREMSRTRIDPPGGPDSSYCEKNWMPVIDMPHHFIKWTNPTELVKADLKTKTTQQVHLSNNWLPLSRDIRGGSQVIPYMGYHIAITHEVDLFNNELGNKDGQYYHRFVIWDKDWNLVKVSEDFKFFGGSIEFSCGMCEYNGNLLITMGFQDSSAHLIVIPLSFFNDFLGFPENFQFSHPREKLLKFPTVNCISFIDDNERRKILEDQLKHYELNHKMHITTHEMDANSVIDGQHIQRLDTRGLYCTTSHLRAIKNWYNTTDEEYGFFVEDDITFETIDYWNFTWSCFLECIPNDWNCLQLALIKENKENASLELKERQWFDDWSVTAYLIKREYAKELIARFYKDEEFTLYLKYDELYPIVENVIYSGGRVYTFPLFIERPNIISTAFKREYSEGYDIETKNHNQKYHNECSNYILNLWKEGGARLTLPSRLTTSYLMKLFINDSKNPFIIYDLAQYYYENKQYASALSLFIRAAEYSQENKIIYEALIKSALILTKFGDRPYSELGAYLNAISFQPTRPEAYYLLSQYYQKRNNWLEAYTYASIGNTLSCNAETTLTDIEYHGYAGLKYIIANSSWYIGKTNQAREMFNDIYINDYHKLNNELKALVNENMFRLGIGQLICFKYDGSMHDNLKQKFAGSTTIEKNYSEAYQDMFVLTMLNGKTDGTYLEIGSSDPFIKSNTALLEKQFNWRGLSVEIQRGEVEKFQKHRKNPIICADALSLNYNEILNTYNLPKIIDYLQVDCEPSQTTFEVLKKIPLNEYQFAVITFEHDHYNDDSGVVRLLSREYLKSFGYVLVGSDIGISDTKSFEDWWAHPALVDIEKIKNMTNPINVVKRADKFMLNE